MSRERASKKKGGAMFGEAAAVTVGNLLFPLVVGASAMSSTHNEKR
jgi:hypothetical protein